MGESVSYWREQPFAYVLWIYRHLQELDHRRQWVGRMQRLDGAMLNAMAFHDPKMLEAERVKALASAAARPEPVLDDFKALAGQLPALLTDHGEG